MIRYVAATPGPGGDDAQHHRGDALRHPVEHLEHEVEHLREVADEGESAKTPLILVAGLLLILIPLAALLIWLVLSLYNANV
jgi:hypothetical protein